MNFQFQMQEIGKQVNVPIDEYQQRLIAASSDENHLAIIITFGGRGILSDIISVISETKERNRGNTAQSGRRRFAEILCPDSCNTQVLLQNHA